MTDIDPNAQPQLVAGDPLTEMLDFSGKPRSMGEKRDFAFKLMKQKMLETTSRGPQFQKVSPLTRSIALKWYEQGLNDAFNVFAQVVEQNTDEELSPG